MENHCPKYTSYTKYHNSYIILLFILVIQFQYTSALSKQIVQNEQNKFSADNCMFIGENGRKYDLKLLQHPQEWIVQDKDASQDTLFGLEYHFNICKNTKESCQDRHPGAFTALDVLGEETDTCEVLGLTANTLVKEIETSDINNHSQEGNHNIHPEEGLTLEIQNGSPCKYSDDPLEQHLQKKLIIDIYCSGQIKLDIFKYDQYAPIVQRKCSPKVIMHHPAICTKKTIQMQHDGSKSVRGVSGQISSSIQWFIKWVFRAFLFSFIYFTFHAFYNYYFMKKTGPDIIPHFKQFIFIGQQTSFFCKRFFKLLKKIEKALKNDNKGNKRKKEGFVPI